MKLIMRIVLLFFIITTLTACGYKEEEISGANKSDISNATTAENEQSVIVPSTEFVTDWECGEYYSSVSLDKMSSYLQELADDGWHNLYGSPVIDSEITDEISECMLVKDNQLLQVLFVLNDRESAINDIYTRYNKNIDVAMLRERKDAISAQEAHKLIQDHINTYKFDNIPDTKQTILSVFEIFIDDAYENMNLQAYAAVSEYGFTGCFLIRNGIVSYIKGNLSNACIADIDNDGHYELLDLTTNLYMGIWKIELFAYDYSIPEVIFSFHETLYIKYYNCFVSEHELPELYLKPELQEKIVILSDNKVNYGALLIDDGTLTIEHMENFPYLQWSTYYDQRILQGMEKETPPLPPDISITIDGLEVDYILYNTNMINLSRLINKSKILNHYLDNDTYALSWYMKDGITFNDSHDFYVNIDFGPYMPDNIHVYDAMLNDQGDVRYNLETETAVKILNQNEIQFKLSQHPAYYASSNMKDYERDWYRLFRVSCQWGEKECEYVFIIKTNGIGFRYFK